MLLAGRNLGAIEIDSTEYDAAVRRCGAHPHGDAHAAVQADARTIYVFPERFLRPVQSNPQSWASPTLLHVQQDQCQHYGIKPKSLYINILQESEEMVEKPEVLNLGIILMLACLFFATGDVSCASPS